MPDWRPSVGLERETDDRWRTVSGPEHGEALRIVRGADGSVEQMVWAGYPVTREPRPLARARIAPTRTAALRARSASTARRAGQIAARRPTTIAAITKNDDRQLRHGEHDALVEAHA